MVLAVLLLMGTSAVMADQVGQYRDRFESGTWSGSDGSVQWSTSWATQGEVNLVSSSSCESGKCVRMGALTTLLGTLRATRGADTSIFDGDLSLRYSLTAASGVGGSLSVRVRAGGGSWETVKAYALGSSFSDHPTIALEDDLCSESFEVRFEYSAVFLGGPVFIDNVEIQGSIAEEPPTTTTTTTTTIPTTTTTKPPPTTTTTADPSPTTERSGSSGSSTSTTSTTVAATTVTTTTLPGGGPGSENGERPPDLAADDTDTAEVIVAGPGTGGFLGTLDGSGIRAAARGLQADFDRNLYGEIRAVSSLVAVDVQAEYNMAVEVIRTSWGWIVLLALLVGYSIVSGLDRRGGAISTEQ